MIFKAKLVVNCIFAPPQRKKKKKFFFSPRYSIGFFSKKKEVQHRIVAESNAFPALFRYTGLRLPLPHTQIRSQFEIVLKKNKRNTNLSLATTLRLRLSQISHGVFQQGGIWFRRWSSRWGGMLFIPLSLCLCVSLFIYLHFCHSISNSSSSFLYIIHILAIRNCLLQTLFI